MRHTYETSTESIKVLKGHEQLVAEELDLNSGRYIYAILAGTETDPFSKFQALYAAAVRAGCPTRFWDERLEATRLRNERHRPLNSVTEAAKPAHESADVSTAFIEHKDPQVKLCEVREEIAQAKRVERALLEEISPTRTIAAEKVNGYRNGNGRR